MIIIKCKGSNYLFKYEGNIEIDIEDEPFLTVSADSTVQAKDDLLRWSSHTWDKFYLEDIESIIGE